MNQPPTEAPLAQSSTDKIEQLLANLPAFVHASGNEGLNAAYAAAIGFGLDIPAAVRSLLPDDPDQLDELLVTLGVQALRCRSDDASIVVAAVDGGTLYSLTIDGTEYIGESPAGEVATDAGDERSEEAGAGSDVDEGATS